MKNLILFTVFSLITIGAIAQEKANHNTSRSNKTTGGIAELSTVLNESEAGIFERRKCVKAGGTFYEFSNGNTKCLPARVDTKSQNMPAEVMEGGISERKECLKSGGVWTTNSDGSFCYKGLTKGVSTSTGTHTNPYFVSNELAGDMPITSNNGGASNTTSSTAQDHNTSRSNTTSSAIDSLGRKSNAVKNQAHTNPYFVDSEVAGDMPITGNNGGASNTTSSTAQDHNTSRSNTTSSAIDSLGRKSNAVKNQAHTNPYFVNSEVAGEMMITSNNGGASNTTSSEAQDHNPSRRSNTNSSVMNGSRGDYDKQSSTLSFSKMLVKMDINKDKKISKSEAKGDLKNNFEKTDINKDGYVTEDEMRMRN